MDSVLLLILFFYLFFVELVKFDVKMCSLVLRVGMIDMFIFEFYEVFVYIDVI